MYKALDNEAGLSALDNLRKRLLDLTARNGLINFKHTKGSSLRVIDELQDQLVETLLTDKEMRFQPVSEPTHAQLIEAGYIQIDEETGEEIRRKKDPTAEEWARWLGLETDYEVPLSRAGMTAQKHADTSIQTLLFPHELEDRLRSLRQKAESAIEELGTTILYLAFGFLEWFDINDTGKPRIAPLFLVPVQIQKGRLNRDTQTYEYTLAYSGEDIIPNLSLREKLRVDFALALPDLDEKTQPEDYCEQVQELIRNNQPSWRVRRHITLALLNFSKLLMYLDLDSARWPEGKSISDHPLINQFLNGYDANSRNDNIEVDLGFGEEYPIDDLPDVHHRYPLIDDADSSQHSALVDAVNGKNLVIEGPPGTGKSQTITNLIAAAISQGKKVLFVAEKLAALEVVKRRLDVAGLGEFCLELHSHKSQKRKVLNEIQQRLQTNGRYRKPQEIESDIARYEELKTLLKDYVEQINRPWKETGKTLHEIFMTATRYREALSLNPAAFHPEGLSGHTFNPAGQRITRDQVIAFGEMYQAIAAQLDDDATLQSHPWYGVRNAGLQILDADRVKESLQECQHSLTELHTLNTELATELGCGASQIPHTLKGLNALLLDLERLPQLKGNELLDTLPLLQGDSLELLRKYLQRFEDIQSVYANLADQVGPEVLADLSLVDNYLNASQQLRKLVTDGTGVDTIATAIQRLQRLQARLNELDEPILEIQVAMGDRGAQYLQSSEAGLQELKVFINTVSALEPQYWQLRNALFDNDELDQALPEIRHKLESLIAVKRQLEDVYNMAILPDESVLADLQLRLAAGSHSRWHRLKRTWRSARKQLLSYAANPKIKRQELMSLLDTAKAFSRDLKHFEHNQNYKRLLGEYAQGLDTQLPALEALRYWYREVRQIYGFGFGPKVSLGDSILKLPIDLARRIRAWSGQGASDQIDEILEELRHVKPVFATFAARQNENAGLGGKDGLVAQLLISLEQPLRQCEGLFTDSTVSITALLQRIDSLNNLREAVTIWRNEDCDNQFFKGRLGLKVGLGLDNEAGVAIAQNTLTVASHIDQEIKTSLITDLIYTAPDESTFQIPYSWPQSCES